MLSKPPRGRRPLSIFAREDADERTEDARAHRDVRRAPSVLRIANLGVRVQAERSPHAARRGWNRRIDAELPKTLASHLFLGERALESDTTPSPSRSMADAMSSCSFCITLSRAYP